MADLSDPVTRDRAGPLVDLTVRGERLRLGPSALKAFFNIIGCWQVRD